MSAAVATLHLPAETPFTTSYEPYRRLRLVETNFAETHERNYVKYWLRTVDERSDEFTKSSSPLVGSYCAAIFGIRHRLATRFVTTYPISTMFSEVNATAVSTEKLSAAIFGIPIRVTAGMTIVSAIPGMRINIDSGHLVTNSIFAEASANLVQITSLVKLSAATPSSVMPSAESMLQIPSEISRLALPAIASVPSSSADSKSVVIAKGLAAFLGVTMQELGKMTGIGRTTFSSWTGNRKQPRPKTLRALYRLDALIAALRKQMGDQEARLWLHAGVEYAPIALLLRGDLASVERLAHSLLFKAAAPSVSRAVSLESQPEHAVRRPTLPLRAANTAMRGRLTRVDR